MSSVVSQHRDSPVEKFCCGRAEQGVGVDGAEKPHVDPVEPLEQVFSRSIDLEGLPVFASVDPRQRQQLQLQDEIWDEEIEAFLDSLKLAPGMRVLEHGCGLGFDLARLARRVAPPGEVVAVEPSPALAEESKALVKRQGLKGVRVVLGDALIEPVPDGLYDLIFCSWKNGQVQAPPASPSILRRLLTQFRSRLKSAGRVAFWEYHLEGIRVVPQETDLQGLLEALLKASPRTKTRASHWLPGELMSTGFLFESAWPRQKAEPPGSPVCRWLEEALRQEAADLVSQKLLDESHWQNMQREWEGRSVDPRTLVFSPQVMGMVARAIDPTLGDLARTR